mgnify:CR=1 FL=1
MLIGLLDICFKTCYYLYIKIFDIEIKICRHIILEQLKKRWR